MVLSDDTVWCLLVARLVKKQFSRHPAFRPSRSVGEKVAMRVVDSTV